MTVPVTITRIGYSKRNMTRPCCLVAVAMLSGCGTQNMIRTANDDCRDFQAEQMVELFDSAIGEEIAHEPPSGYKTQPYDPSQWIRYWNDRFFYIYDIGPSDCHGQYIGPSGPDLIRHIIQERRQRGLPDIPLDPRNVGRVSET